LIYLNKSLKELNILNQTYFRSESKLMESEIKSNSTQNVFYDKNGTVIFESYGAGNPENVKLADIPDLVKKK
jgi:hypothetical protein